MVGVADFSFGLSSAIRGSKLCQDNPPHLEMVSCCVEGQCDPETVRKFYELQPQCLREKSVRRGCPISVSVKGRAVLLSADLFIWVAEQYPEEVYHKEGEFCLLHRVCKSLAGFCCTPNMSKIGRFLISVHPGLIRQKGKAKSCNRPLVQVLKS